jgi:peroxin-19
MLAHTIHISLHHAYFLLLFRREKQCICFQRLVRVYETEPDNVPCLMDLMQEVQEYGQPPSEIIQEIAPGIELDAEGMPKIDGSGLPFPPNEECCIM